MTLGQASATIRLDAREVIARFRKLNEQIAEYDFDRFKRQYGVELARMVREMAQESVYSPATCQRMIEETIVCGAEPRALFRRVTHRDFVDRPPHCAVMRYTGVVSVEAKP